jgi:hypothetical protein
MPRRHSPEERAASFYRAGCKSPPAPKALSPRARAIWRQIVGAKPIDWFDGGNYGYLADHCEEQARLEAIWVKLREVAPGSKESRNLTNELKTVRGNLATSARHLRLTVQETVDRAATKTAERQPKVTSDSLFGGAAVNGPKIKRVI